MAIDLPRHRARRSVVMPIMTPRYSVGNSMISFMTHLFTLNQISVLWKGILWLGLSSIQEKRFPGSVHALHVHFNISLPVAPAAEFPTIPISSSSRLHGQCYVPHISN